MCKEDGNMTKKTVKKTLEVLAQTYFFIITAENNTPNRLAAIEWKKADSIFTTNRI